MHPSTTGTLLAISYNYIPELQQLREQYYAFWNAIGAIAILGWVFFYLLHRRSANRVDLAARDFGRHIGPTPFRVVLGLGFGWIAWGCLEPWWWADIGVGHRWQGELLVCLLGGIGWVFVLDKLRRWRAAHEEGRLRQPG